MVAAALIDRLVDHATMITPKGKSYGSGSRAPTSPPPPRLRRYATPRERRDRLAQVVRCSAPKTGVLFGSY
jgi:hypothetical protein